MIDPLLAVVFVTMKFDTGHASLRFPSLSTQAIMACWLVVLLFMVIATAHLDLQKAVSTAFRCFTDPVYLNAKCAKGLHKELCKELK